ncbi:hypothetical protein ACJQWK_09070 [Exserohilum turcicum]|uniref:DUF3669 domain-containing protein n=1 Tax=Exserohilum turcicum (strain 28A) TaxID=671987 RepID=R0ITJ7_EXST2|nr:uncharacterized protein SETTUDRAFT_39093 [Exserohilum turcica Et28A]EOA87971.1 hypothetical protein SETTUDRAFT_39093 [Exserohilum turcica Et28A]
MRMLGLDYKSYAEAMAEALALMHWGARIDANDVEFVLAPPRAKHPHASTFQSDYLGAHCMWLLDFDRCQPMQMNEAGIEQACAAFFRNDPYYPRPGTGEAADEELWIVFKQRFLASSRRILGEENQDMWVLADRLIARIEEEGEERRRKDALAASE